MADGDDPDGSLANDTVSRAAPRFVYDIFSGAAPRFVYDIFALAWIAIAGLAVLFPALSHGSGIYSYTGVEDKIDSAIPLTTLAWREVHAGHLPLWNPYSALGVPLAFNLNSMDFSVPALIGYVFPLRLDYAVQLITTLFISGTGVYVFGRVLRVGVLGSVFAATAFELSGALVFFFGPSCGRRYGLVGVAFRGRNSVVRGKHRARWIAAFAVIIACAIYAGQPQELLELLVCLVLFLVVFLGPRALRPGGLRATLRPAGDLALAAAAGVALAAPLALPALQLAGHSFDTLKPLFVLAPSLRAFFFAGQNAATAPGMYIGLICVVLAAVGVGFRWRRPEISGLGVVVIAMAAVLLFHPLLNGLNATPLLKEGDWGRAFLPMIFALSVLGGVGVDVLLRSADRHAVTRWIAAGFAVAGFGVLMFFLSGIDNHVPPLAAVRTRTFVLRAVEVGGGFVAVGALVVADWRRTRRQHVSGRLGARTLAALVLLICETTVLVVAGSAIWSSTGETPLTDTRGYQSLQKAVGSSLVGFGNSNCFPFSLGILQNINAMYKVHELDAYGNLLPSAYVKAWQAETGTSAYVVYALYCPAVTTAKIARRYGVGFVLEPKGAPGPQGAIFDGNVSSYAELYRIPGAAAATITPLSSGGNPPGPDAPSSPVPVSYPAPAAWKVSTDSRSPSVLRLRLTDVPGWHATIDGKPLSLQPFSGIMLQASIPPGRHTIELHYWPERFTIGIVLAACAAAGLLLVPVVRRRLVKPAPMVDGERTRDH